MSLKKKSPIARAKASLLRPAHASSGEELVVVTRQQVDGIQHAADYPNHPPVQAAATAVLATANSLDSTLLAITNKKGELETLMRGRDTILGTLTLQRSDLQNAVTTASKGSPDAVTAWSCHVQTRAVPQPTNEAPQHLVLKNDRTTPGTLLARCKAVKGAASYVFVFTTDPSAPLGTGTSVPSSKAHCVTSGQPLGHVLYARVAVIRTAGGQSAWSEPIQILVR